MSPEIRVEGELIASVPDEAGTHQTLAGKPLHVNVDCINADGTTHGQKIILAGEEIGGKRELGLTLEGIGDSNDPKRGDKKYPKLSVTLLNRPIRVTYAKLAVDADGKYIRGPRQTHKNPRWVKGQGQR